ncbi:MAG: hypothetical protein U0R65_08185 [Candidatus Nanopelagicales bacterium]|jgi:hypothetical protein
MTHLAPSIPLSPAARSVLRSTGVLALSCAMTVLVLVAAASVIGSWS